jgi:hypothetical protein
MTFEDGDGITVRGRTFSATELVVVREIVAKSPLDSRYQISKNVCAGLGWQQANGRPKDRSCRALLQKLERAGFLQLPAPRRAQPPRRPIPLTSRTAPRLPFALAPREVGLEHFRVATHIEREERLWNEFVERYHYLKFGVVVGPQLKYFVEVRGEPVACMAFGGAAWKVEPRDRWIGWSTEQRKNNLRYVVNNTRYLLFPWIKVKNLASRLLALAAKRLPDDWHRIYGYRPCLLETFVNTDRHPGTCYKAANWILVGQTKGRGKMDRYAEAKLPKKAMYVYRLVPDVHSVLTAATPPSQREAQQPAATTASAPRQVADP